MDIAEHRRLTARDDGDGFKDWLLGGPHVQGFEVERDRRPARDVDLEVGRHDVFLLDTNILSELRRPRCNAGVRARAEAPRPTRCT